MYFTRNKINLRRNLGYKRFDGFSSTVKSLLINILLWDPGWSAAIENVLTINIKVVAIKA